MRNLFYYDIAKFRTKLKWINRNYLVTSISLAVILPLLLLNVGVKNSSIHKIGILQKQKSDLMLKKLNELNNNLESVKDNQTITEQQKVILKNLESDIFTLQKSYSYIAKTTDIQNMSNQITVAKEDINGQLSDFKKIILETLGHKDYLNVAILPFHVIAVDVIAGQPYVTVDYANHVLPLAIGDTLATWRVSEADYDTGTVELVNEKKQFVQVNIRNVSDENKQ